MYIYFNYLIGVDNIEVNIYAKIYFKNISDNRLYFETNFCDTANEFNEELEIYKIFGDMAPTRVWYLLFYDYDQIIITTKKPPTNSSYTMIDLFDLCEGIDVLISKGIYDYLEESMKKIEI